MLLMMRRTQLYLDDDLWNALHFHARLNGTTISDLVRKSARDKYMGNPEERSAAMQGIVGLWKDRGDIEITELSVRGIRRGARMQRIEKE
jgi:hypothetical protein